MRSTPAVSKRAAERDIGWYRDCFELDDPKQRSIGSASRSTNRPLLTTKPAVALPLVAAACVSDLLGGLQPWNKANIFNKVNFW
ncbi:MAG: hypothetical protein CM15mP120_19130 [Pseudomonadota bacterium]|nr:MAG: hypothetical protein CM15mP120_19130 [Pseudomonadota bacterium]